MKTAGGDGGFTIVEVAVAMAIFLSVMLAVLAMFDSSHRLFARSRLLTKATNLATDKIADFRFQPLADIGVVADVGKGEIEEIIDGETWIADIKNEEGTTYTRRWKQDIVDVDGDNHDDFPGDLKKVDVLITWTFNNIPHQVRMETVTTGKLN